jgi:hypothetical protein
MWSEAARALGKRLRAAIADFTERDSPFRKSVTSFGGVVAPERRRTARWPHASVPLPDEEKRGVQPSKIAGNSLWLDVYTKLRELLRVGL